ncbi:MAG: hypothetical protein ACLGIN_07015 [Candidatus Sericytochromatia bacterium]
MEKWQENRDTTREEVGESFHAEMPPVAPDVVPEEEQARRGMAPPGDPDGYVGLDGRARPHEEPAEVARRQRQDPALEGEEREILEGIHDTED